MEENKETFVEPLDWTDPIVFHDPVNKPVSTIAKQNEPQNAVGGNEKTGEKGTFQLEDSKNVDGIYVPVIKLNNIVIDSSNINSMTINYKGFYPELELYINDIDNKIQFMDTPGQNNVINIVITTPKDGAYRKISLNFYIIKFKKYGDKLYYKGEYKLLEFKKDKFKGIITDGCSKCGLSKNNKLTTFEYLHEIAIENGLGFAATEDCINVQDRVIRLLQNVNYYDFINNEIKFSGLDVDSMFDCWIDLYGYIVLVNVAWVLNSKITSRSLSVVSIKGVKTTDNNTPEQEFEKVFRNISNWNMQSKTNDLEIDSYELISNPALIYRDCTLQTYSMFTPEGVSNGSNNISTEQIQIIEDSVDGQFIEEYQTESSNQIFLEFNDYPLNLQERKRDAFFNKLRAKTLKVVMKNINLGLQRGTLLGVNIFEYDPTKKNIILQGYQNVDGNYSLEQDPMEDTRATADNDSLGVPNNALTGMYYIDGMEFKYNENVQQIIQTLYLIKKDGFAGNYSNKHTLGKIQS